MPTQSCSYRRSPAASLPHCCIVTHTHLTAAAGCCICQLAPLYPCADSFPLFFFLLLLAAGPSCSGDLGVSLPTGWTYTTKAGSYGDQYLLRAAVALVGLGANSPEVAIYAANFIDSKGKPLSAAGSATYTLTVQGMPPARFFSSLTLYAVADNLLMDNMFSDRANLNFKATPGLQWNSDGSLTVYISAAPPGPKGSEALANWLPAGPEPFWILWRFYGASNDVIQGKYNMPALVRAS